MGKTPILVISAKTQLSDRILGIDLGADDYIIKLFEPLEVAAKVKAHLRRVDAQYGCFLFFVRPKHKDHKR